MAAVVVVVVMVVLVAVVVVVVVVEIRDRGCRQEGEGVVPGVAAKVESLHTVMCPLHTISLPTGAAALRSRRLLMMT